MAGGRSADEWLEAYGRVHRRDKASMRVVRTLYTALHERRSSGEGTTVPLRVIAQRASRPGDLISHATVRRVVERLAALGLIVVTTGRGRGHPFEYHLPGAAIDAEFERDRLEVEAEINRLDGLTGVIE